MERSYGYLDYAKILGLERGGTVYLSSDTMQMIMRERQNGTKFDGVLFLESFLDELGDEGTLCLPTFNFEFCEKGYYDIKKSRGMTGALGNVALGHPSFKRTSHPMHSFAVAGREQELLCSLDHADSFDEQSPFHFFYENNAVQVIAGTDYQRAMTFVHYVENCCKVPYRYYKNFTGTYKGYDDVLETRTIRYYARNLEVNPIEKFNRIGRVLEEEKISRETVINGISFIIVDLAASFDVIRDNICSSHCSLLYDFEREDLISWD